MSLTSVLLPERSVPEIHKNELDAEIANVLAAKDLPADTKYQLYQNIVHQYKQMHQQMKKPLKLDFAYEPSKVVSVETFPKTLKQKAANLINFIDTLPDIKIGEKGELNYKDHPIRGSNYIDLVHDFVRDRRKRTRPPIGARELALALREANVPHEFIGNQQRWQLIEGGPNLFSSSSKPQSGEGSLKWTPY